MTIFFDSMLARLYGGVGRLHAEGFITGNFEKVRELADEKMFFDALLNPLMLIVLGLFVIFGILTKSKKILMLIFGLYGYSAVYHYTLEKNSLAGVNFENVGGGNISSMVIFFIGVLAVTAVILYVIFVRGD